jgi:hypothetical protein
VEQPSGQATTEGTGASAATVSGGSGEQYSNGRHSPALVLPPISKTSLPAVSPAKVYSERGALWQPRKIWRAPEWPDLRPAPGARSCFGLASCQQRLARRTQLGAHECPVPFGYHLVTMRI